MIVKRMGVLMLATVLPFMGHAASEKIGKYTWEYSMYTDGVEITSVTPKSGDIIIPSQLGGYDVVRLGSDAFGSAGFERFVIGSTVKSIGSGCFYASSISNLVIGTGVATIGNDAFGWGQISELDFLGPCPSNVGGGSGGSWLIAAATLIRYPFVHKEAYSKCVPADKFAGYILTQVESPTIQSATLSFSTASQEVSLSCETEGATIYYTIDGSEPSAANGRKYKGPFDIYQTMTVKAIAVKDDWKDSAVASATFTKENAIGPAINLLEVLPDNDKTHPWEVVTDVTHDGVSAVKSGAIDDGEMTTLKVAIYGAGELSFWWKASCEPSIDGEYYDYGTFFNGTTAVTNIAGVTDWQQVRLAVAGTGKHTFKWTYQKDDSFSMTPDGAWLDQVQWLPETTDYYADHTLTTETPVEYKWLRKYGLGMTNDFEAAAKAKSGKRDGAGRELTVEDDYIAGTNPTNINSQLTGQIEMIDGVPNITWNPDMETERNYKIWGSGNLTDWEYPTNALHRFFKVTVEMP